MLSSAQTIANQPRLEFWFEFGSSYSYMATMRIEALANRAGVILDWRPFLLGPVFRKFGWDTSPFVLQSAKGEYMWRDMERQARKYGLPFKKPSVFPRVAVMPMRVAVLAIDKPWMGEFCRNVMKQNWIDDLDINDRLNVRRALIDLVPDPDAVIAAALSDANKVQLRSNTDEAFGRGIFGAPTMFAGGEMFWGDDRLDDAIACAATARCSVPDA
jgi:2-hydroxychromene-2-carboxylate isomerase